jgi:hypothetical protein
MILAPLLLAAIATVSTRSALAFACCPTPARSPQFLLVLIEHRLLALRLLQ